MCEGVAIIAREPAEAKAMADDEGEIVQTQFRRYDEASQPRQFVAGYRSTATRTPAAPALDAAPGLTELTGPVFEADEASSGAVDIATDPATGRRAIGQLIH